MALVEENENYETRKFRLTGTGHSIKDSPGILNYIGTFQLLEGRFVGHIFEIKIENILEEEKKMKIVELRAENIKKISAVLIRPKEDDNVVLITGKNDAGKSSIMDCIAMAIGGEKLIPKEPVKKGKKTATIRLDLGEYIVTRHWTNPYTSYLKVKSKEGGTYGQRLLDKFVGSLSFDPHEFTNMDKRKQKETLLGLVKLDIDLDDNAKQRNEAYQERTIVNREIKKLEAELSGMGELSKEIEEEISTTDVIKRLEDAQDVINKNQDEKRKLEKLKDVDTQIIKELKINEKKIDEIKEKIKYLENEKLALEKEQKELQQNIKDSKKNIEEQKTICSELKEPDIEAIKKELQDAEEYNKSIIVKKKQRENYEKIKAELEIKQKDSDALTKRIEFLDNQKEDALTNAKFPIEGLGIDEYVTYNDIPFEQLSLSQQLKVSLAIAMALNPKLRVIRIMDGSLLDSKNMKIIEEMAKDKDYQIWIEKVDETGDVGIYIEDGTIQRQGELI